MEIASAFVSLLPSMKGFGSNLTKQIGGEVDASGKSLGSKFGGLFKLAAGAAVGAGAVDFLKDSFAEARESQKVSAQTAAAIKSTGGAANITANQIGNLSTAISNKVGIDDEAIQSGANLLLTFTNIRNEAGKGNKVFDQATKTLVDMGAALGGDPKSSAIQLGKALNDPVKGITALQRVGVTFNDTQKKQIKTMVDTGHTMDAQKVILHELNREFGGSAAAQATAGDKAKVAWGNVKEAVGTALLPVLDGVLNLFLKFAPTLQAAAGQIGPIFTSITAAVSPVVGMLRDRLEPAFDAIGKFVKRNTAFFKPFAIALGIVAGAIGIVTLATTAFSVALNSTGIPLIVLGIAALGAGLYLLYQRSSTFRDVIAKVGSMLTTQVLPVLQSFAEFLLTRVAPAVVAIVQAVAQNLKPIFDQLVQTFQARVLPAIQQILAKFREWQPTIQRVIAVLVQIIGKILVFAAAVLGRVLPVIIRFVGFLLAKLVPAVLGVIGVLIRIVAVIVNVAAAFVNGVAAVGKFVAGVTGKIGQAISIVVGMPGRIIAALGDLGKLLFQSGQKIIQGLIDGIKAGAGKVKSAVKDVLQGARNLLPFSPAKEGPFSGKGWTLYSGQSLMQGLADGISKSKGKVKSAIQQVLQAVRDAISQVAGSISQAFGGDLFSADNAQAFLDNLTSENGTIAKLKAAFKTLLGWGWKPEALSQLFQSGNAALILSLAGNQTLAQQASTQFNAVQSGLSSLGNQVATTQFSLPQKTTINKLDELIKAVKGIGIDVGGQINTASAKGARTRKKGPKK